MPVPVSDSTLINQVRQQFMTQEYATNPSQYDEIDIDRIRGQDDWFVQRFITTNDAESAVKAMVVCLKWRKAIGINQLSVNDFPAEFYATGGLIKGGVDKQGNRLIILRVKFGARYNSQLDDLAKKFLAYQLNAVDLETRGQGFAVVFDCSGAGISNVNMEILRFMVSSLTVYFPNNAAYVLVYELPWILNSIWGAIKSCLHKEHREKVLFGSKKDIYNRIDASQWPQVLGGEWTSAYIRTAPKLAPTMVELATKWGYSTNELKRVQDFFAKILAIPY